MRGPRPRASQRVQRAYLAVQPTHAWLCANSLPVTRGPAIPASDQTAMMDAPRGPTPDDGDSRSTGPGHADGLDGDLDAIRAQAAGVVGAHPHHDQRVARGRRRGRPQLAERGPTGRAATPRRRPAAAAGGGAEPGAASGPARRSVRPAWRGDRCRVSPRPAGRAALPRGPARPPSAPAAMSTPAWAAASTSAWSRAAAEVCSADQREPRHGAGQDRQRHRQQHGTDQRGPAFAAIQVCRRGRCDRRRHDAPRSAGGATSIVTSMSDTSRAGVVADPGRAVRAGSRPRAASLSASSRSRIRTRRTRNRSASKRNGGDAAPRPVGEARGIEADRGRAGRRPRRQARTAVAERDAGLRVRRPARPDRRVAVAPQLDGERGDVPGDGQPAPAGAAAQQLAAGRVEAIADDLDAGHDGAVRGRGHTGDGERRRIDGVGLAQLEAGLRLQPQHAAGRCESHSRRRAPDTSGPGTNVQRGGQRRTTACGAPSAMVRIDSRSVAAVSSGIDAVEADDPRQDRRQPRRQAQRLRRGERSRWNVETDARTIARRREVVRQQTGHGLGPGRQLARRRLPREGVRGVGQRPRRQRRHHERDRHREQQLDERRASHDACTHAGASHAGPRRADRSGAAASPAAATRAAVAIGATRTASERHLSDAGALSRRSPSAARKSRATARARRPRDCGRSRRGSRRSRRNRATARPRATAPDRCRRARADRGSRRWSCP